MNQKPKIQRLGERRTHVRPSGEAFHDDHLESPQIVDISSIKPEAGRYKRGPRTTPIAPPQQYCENQTYCSHLPLEIYHAALLGRTEGPHDGLEELLALLVVEELAESYPD